LEYIGRSTAFIGEHHNLLTIIEKAEKPLHVTTRGDYVWCQCDCGNPNLVRVSIKNFKAGYVKSCGCIRKGSKTLDITGQTFNYLKVLNRNEEKTAINPRKVIWDCKCLLCGSITSVAGSNLKNNHTKSCGCLKSDGETKIAILLQQNNINFKKQFGFNDLKYKNPLKFDFAILDSENNLSHLIEFDGSQHYIVSGWNTKENFKLVQERDNLKNKYCKNNNIKLIRIKYNEEITLEKLIGGMKID